MTGALAQFPGAVAFHDVQVSSETRNRQSGYRVAKTVARQEPEAPRFGSETGEQMGRA